MPVTRGQCDARPTVTLPAAHWLVPNYTAWWQRHMCVLTTCPGLHWTARRPGFELATCWSQVQHPNHSTTKPHMHMRGRKWQETGETEFLLTLNSLTLLISRRWFLKPYGAAQSEHQTFTLFTATTTTCSMDLHGEPKKKTVQLLFLRHLLRPIIFYIFFHHSNQKWSAPPHISDATSKNVTLIALLHTYEK